MAKYLITGGAGFIGSSLAKRLIELGNKVIIIDNLLTGQKENLPSEAVFILGDISNPDNLKKVFNDKLDGVFHLAAQSSGEISNEKPELDLLTNSYGTFLLLQMAKNIGVKRFIYSSSMSVYGNTENNPVKENEKLMPLSYYGISKLSGEHYMRHFIDDGLNGTIFRFFSVYGPGQNMTNMKQGMVSIYMSYILNHKPIQVKGSKDRFRDFIYIDDVVDVLVSSINEQKTYGKVYNLGTGVKTTVEQLIGKMLKSFIYKQGEYEVVYKGTTPADQFGLYADISKISKELLWRPKVGLDLGLKKMVEWTKIKLS